MRQVNVLAMAHLYPPAHNAGAEWMLHTLLRTLVDAGHRVDVLLSRDHPGYQRSFLLHGVKVWPQFSECDRPPADLVISHLENTPRASVLAGQWRIPVVHVLHNTFSGSRYTLAAYQPDLTVTNSHWMRADLTDWWSRQSFGTMPRLTTVHPVVVERDYITFGDHERDRVTLVNLTETKGARVFYALAELMPEVKFLGVHGAYGEQLVRTDLPNVELLAHLTGLDMAEKVYRRTKVLLTPSDYESWGRVGVEAMCSGIPVIAHPTPGLHESLGTAGTFIDRAHIAEWATAIRQLSAGPTRDAARLAAQRRVVQLERRAENELTDWVRLIEALARTVPEIR